MSQLINKQFTTLCLLLIFNGLMILQTQAQCDLNDWKALKILFENTNGENWNNSTNWHQVNTTTKPRNCNLSTLFGVKLNNAGRVVFLELSENNLRGIIPSQLTYLTELKELWLWGNQLTGNIPYNLNQLTKLTHLDIGINQLTGFIPANLGDLSNLEELYFDSNQLTGKLSAQIGNLNNLNFLYLSNNQLNGCFDSNLKSLCGQIANPEKIGEGNSFNTDWIDFCNTGKGTCDPKFTCRQTDSLTLIAFNNALKGDQWSTSLRWDFSQPINTWSGVTLNANGCVDRLDLGETGMNGTLAPEIGNFSEITWIDLSKNNISGTIPVSIGNLSNLEYLNLNENQLSGSIPSTISYLTSLKYLYLSNQLTGSIPSTIGNLMNLVSLDLPNNQLTGDIPSTIGNLSNLKSLNLHVNRLTGNIPSTIGDLVNIESLYLRNNRLTGNIPSTIGNLTKLKSLSISNNQLTGSIPPSIGNLSKLEHLNLVHNQLTGSIPLTTGDLTNLKELYLSNNQITGSMPGWLADMDAISQFTIQNNQLSGCYTSDLSRLCDKLSPYSNRNVKISSGNNLAASWEEFCTTQAGECTFCHIDDFEALKSLFINTNGNQWTKNDHWKNTLVGVKKTLGNESSCDLRNLYGISLNENGRVTQIKLDNNNLNGSLTPDIGKLSNLTSLLLSNNNLKGKLPKELGNLSELSYLSLFLNNLTGNIPSTLGNLNNLQALALGVNQLSGNIPNELSQLVNLQHLSLDQNKLSGIIPPGFVNLKQLTDLWIWGNKLSGEIPEFTNDDLLLDVSQNYFSCVEIEKYYRDKNLPSSKYSPQFYNPFNEIKSNVYNTNTSINLEAPFENNSNNLQYQWKQNGIIIDGANTSNLNIENIKGTNAGKYTLHITNVGCIEELEFISDPNYLIVDGYNYEGKEVEYSQILMEFENSEITRSNDFILAEQAGWVLDKCNCNREIYLWQIPGNEQDADEFLDQLTVKTERKVLTIKKRNEVEGSFSENFRLVNTDEGLESAYKISQELSDNSSEPVTIYLLDSGLDETNYNAKPYLLSQVPKDNCYNISTASGYGYTEIGNEITTNYKDERGHGTYGFRTITSDLNSNHNIKVVPLKVFNKDGEGNLFKLICALYHAIDNNADIINISAGYQGESATILEKAIALAKEKGIFIVTSAGNNGVDIDNELQYPAKYANMSVEIEDYDSNGNLKSEPLIFDHVISVASIGADNQLSGFSNFGKHSVTLSTYGEKIYGYGLEGILAAPSGTSMAAFFVTKALALELAQNKNRTQQAIWNDFVLNRLIDNAATKSTTITGKRLNVNIASVNYNAIGGDRLMGADKDLSIQIFPNPATDWLTINLNNTSETKNNIEKGSISIYDHSGKLVLKKSYTIKNNIILNVQQLKSSQYYYVQYSDNEGTNLSTSFFKL